MIDFLENMRVELCMQKGSFQNKKAERNLRNID